MVKKNEVNAQLVNRLSRIIGQVEAIKSKISSSDFPYQGQHCLDIMNQVKAANNALKKFSEAYMQFYLNQCFLQSLPLTSHDNQASTIQNMQKMKENLEEVIKSSFAL